MILSRYNTLQFFSPFSSISCFFSNMPSLIPDLSSRYYYLNTDYLGQFSRLLRSLLSFTLFSFSFSYPQTYHIILIQTKFKSCTFDFFKQYLQLKKYLRKTCSSSFFVLFLLPFLFLSLLSSIIL